MLAFILQKFLRNHSLIDSTPPWYTKIEMKPRYENDVVTMYWDIPEYTGHVDETEEHVLRPDGKIVLKEEKCIYVLEMSMPWIENRESKLAEKTEKYKDLVQTLKVDNPTFEVKQLTFIVDCLGGYSKSFLDSLKTMGFDKTEIDKICLDVQKIAVTEAANSINKFKVLTTR